ncbi:SprT-like family protein [Chitinophaga costaii]|uniref:SprT-like family protein n=1 Tax=Chitinophaga costaii TaxID=1335309 RepID=A0A1C4DBJ3_9BACT|nr:SprT-like domain-containing protein [Chitinophaga costaii]PUZ24551.1 hypothetical protein DCM91_11690 [Chitinophaga costaii]SCC28734.1 SprT-like family protein [Chitinophaga costaii]
MAAKQEAPLHALAAYLPAGTSEEVMPFILEYKVHLTITRERQSILGDYRHPYDGSGHRISINGNLNPYAFLITLLHEIAHLVTWVKYANRVAAHGKEWKHEFAEILRHIIGRGFMPTDVEAAIMAGIHSPAASSCADENLMRVLRRYDPQKVNHFFVEQLPEGAIFKTKDGRIFRKGARIRKRFRCEEIATKRVYLFSPVYEVEAAEA